MQTPSLIRLFLRQLVPTVPQAFLALALAGVIIVVSRLDSVARFLGITTDGVHSVQDNLHLQTAGILGSAFASNFVLVAFWGMVGLIAYLVTWAIMNIIIEARNTVTVDTQYANRGHWHGPWQTLAIKSVCALILVLILATFRYGVLVWLDIVHLAFASSLLVGIGLGLAAWLGFALQLYVTYLAIVLTFTPWYHTSAFTE